MKPDRRTPLFNTVLLYFFSKCIDKTECPGQLRRRSKVVATVRAKFDVLFIVSSYHFGTFLWTSLATAFVLTSYKASTSVSSICKSQLDVEEIEFSCLSFDLITFSRARSCANANFLVILYNCVSQPAGFRQTDS